MARDYHTAGKGGYLKASGQVERRNLIVSTRYYLAGARFLVGFEGEDLGLLRALHEALRDPHWPLFLGRKAFVPGEPVWLEDGLMEGIGLEPTLKRYPWLGPEHREPPEQLRLVLEDPRGPEVRPDQPLSFSERRFAPRRVRTVFVDGPRRREEV
jgi:CRISPR system Cascade subunit CasD